MKVLVIGRKEETVTDFARKIAETTSSEFLGEFPLIKARISRLRDGVYTTDSTTYSVAKTMGFDAIVILPSYRPATVPPYFPSGSKDEKTYAVIDTDTGEPAVGKKNKTAYRSMSKYYAYQVVKRLNHAVHSKTRFVVIEEKEGE